MIVVCIKSHFNPWVGQIEYGEKFELYDSQPYIDFYYVLSPKNRKRNNSNKISTIERNKFIDISEFRERKILEII